MGENPIEELLSKLEGLMMRRIVGQTFGGISHPIADTRVVMGGVHQLFSRLRRC
jgi:hypothetical protein